MKKLLAVFVVSALLIGGAGTIGVTQPETTSHIEGSEATATKTTSATFQAPRITEQGGYIQIHMENCGVTGGEGKPMLPVWRTTIKLPFGSTVNDVSVTTGDLQQQKLHHPVRPARQAVAPGMEPMTAERSPDSDVYRSAALYPGSWSDYDVASGIQHGERVTTVTVTVYPVQYSPADSTLRFCRQADVTVDYRPPAAPVVQKDEYDLLVVSPESWTDALQPLAEHKESHGIDTTVVSMASVKSGEYFEPQGRDDAETLKYFIKNAVEEWGVTYVLLVGGRKPGIREQWHIPVRYVAVTWPTSENIERRYVSDLYFADIYNGTGDFASWDTDDNDVFYEWNKMGQLKDDGDLYPDVHLGRWACRSKAEVNVMVDKTIAYEQGSASKRVSLIGGDNFPASGVEGEIVCDTSLAYLDGYEASKVYASEMDVTTGAIKETLNTGAAFLHMHGHGSPMSWSTHKPGNFDEWEPGIDVLDLPLFFNDEYTIAVIGGCHTAMFNVSMTVHPWTGGVPSPEGTSWWLARKVNGGGIASLGYTAFPVATPGEDGDLDGDGVEEPDCVESGYGYMQLEVFNGYGQHGLEHLGACWSHAVSSYTEHFKTPAQRYHLHTIQSFVLLGDPTLKIGGY